MNRENIRKNGKTPFNYRCDCGSSKDVKRVSDGYACSRCRKIESKMDEDKRFESIHRKTILDIWDFSNCNFKYE